MEAELLRDYRGNTNLVVNLRVDKGCPWEYVAAVFDRCQRNGIMRIAPRYEPPKRP